MCLLHHPISFCDTPIPRVFKQGVGWPIRIETAFATQHIRKGWIKIATFLQRKTTSRKVRFQHVRVKCRHISVENFHTVRELVGCVWVVTNLLFINVSLRERFILWYCSANKQIQCKKPSCKKVRKFQWKLQ